jgi:hypothetical protein
VEEGVRQGEGVSPAATVVQRILGNELMRGIIANQREAEEGGGHHEVFSRPYVSPPFDTPGQIMTFIDGAASFISLNCKLGGVDEHGLIEDGPRGRGPDCGSASSPILLHFLDDGRIDVDRVARGADSLAPIMGDRVVLEDLGEFFGGGTSIGRLLVHLVGRDRGLNEDIDLPRNPFDLDDLVQFLVTVFWRAMRISTRCTRHRSCTSYISMYRVSEKYFFCGSNQARNTFVRCLIRRRKKFY